jgi:peptidoglycan/xylan/chitin deacetylase (PgdA/CDA1 family)
MRNALLLLLCGLGGLSAVTPAAYANEESTTGSAVILAYHRIGEDEYPASNLRIEQFKEHLHELTTGPYKVMPLPDIIAAIKTKQPLPPGAIAITFEGAYKSVLENAVPLLMEKNIPFTVFYSASLADNPSSQYMEWSDLKRLESSQNVTLGLLPASYTRLTDAPRDEILADLNKARARHREKFGGNATLFSYPFGEYDLAYRNLIEEQQFDAAFGLQSGVAYNGSDMYTLPRFTMTEPYGDTERFLLVANALPLPVSNVEPADPYLKSSIANIGFSVDEALAKDLTSLSCFVSGQNDVSMEIVGGRRVELRPAEELEDERIRVNCTMPVASLGENPRWRWFGMMLVNKNGASPELAELP